MLVEGRRPVGYYLCPRTRGAQLSMFEEEFVPLELVNTIRERENVRAHLRRLVKRVLRKHGYPPDKQERATQTVLEGHRT